LWFSLIEGFLSSNNLREKEQGFKKSSIYYELYTNN
jgi:hypothetical protein